MISDYVDDLDRELRAASGRRLRLETARVPRAPAGAVPALATVAVCVVVALTLLQAGVRQRTTQPGSAGAAGAVPAGAQGLVRRLAVLRRPQTAADRIRLPGLIVPTYIRPGLTVNEPVRLVGTLTRVVERLPSGRRIVVVVGKVGGSSAYVACLFVWPDNVQLVAPAPEGFQAVLKTLSVPRYPIRTVGRVLVHDPVLTLTAADLRAAQLPQYYYDRGASIELVPDGVDRVTLYQRVGSGPIEQSSTLVTNNVVLVPGAASSRVPVDMLALEWMASDGRVLSTTPVMPPPLGGGLSQRG